MLYFSTALTAFMGMAVSLWLAAYLLARGFSSRITLRAVVTLVTLTAFFISAYLNIYLPTPGSTVWRAAFLTAGFLAWYDLSLKSLPLPAQRRMRIVAWAVYALGLAAVAILFTVGNIFVDPGSPLLVTRVHIGPGFIAYGFCLVMITGATLYNFRWGAQIGAGPHNRYFSLATLVAAGTTIMGYITTALGVTPSLPRLVQDALLLAAISLLGYAVATHQALVERRTALQDFPVSGLAIFGLVGIYALAAWQRGFSPEEIAFITVLAILTHSAYDLVRELLDRLLHRHEGALRRKLRELARNVGGKSSLQDSLHKGLSVLCHTLNASSGFIALRQEGQFVVSAAFKSFALGSQPEATELTGIDLSQPTGVLAERVAWLAPAFVGQEQVAVIGLGPRATQDNYSEDALDVLADMADWVGLIVFTHAQQQANREHLIQLAAEVQSRELGLQASTADLITTFENNPDGVFMQWVEKGLRNLPDYTALAQLPLAAQLGVVGKSHLERGKAVRQLLMEAVENLRPAQQRPAEPLPREWHGYSILHDAYIEDVPNREIMARLYISDGTFHRQRRKALRAVARHLLEMNSGAPSIRTWMSQATLDA